MELVSGLLVVAAFIGWQARAVATSTYPGLRATATLMISFSALIVLFATTYLLIATAEPKAFTEPMSRIDAIYFAVTVFTTVGFGDIAAQSEPARIWVTIQMLTDLIFIGVAVRALVHATRRGLASSGRNPDQARRITGN
jgi:hypothetical protein